MSEVVSVREGFCGCAGDEELLIRGWWALGVGSVSVSLVNWQWGFLGGWGGLCKISSVLVERGLRFVGVCGVCMGCFGEAFSRVTASITLEMVKQYEEIQQKLMGKREKLSLSYLA